MSELNATIEKLGNAFESFKAEHAERFNEQERKIELLDDALGRMKFHGGSSVKLGDGASLDGLSKDLAAFARTGRPTAGGDLLKTSSDPDGGFTVPERLNEQILETAKEAVTMRKLARVVRGGPDYKQITNPEGAQVSWGTEHTARPDTETPTLAEVSFVFGEMFSVAPITNWLLDDSFFDLGNWLLESILNGFSLAENEAFMTGNGVGRPKGITAYDFESTDDSSRDWGKFQYVASGAASTFTDADKLVDLVYALRPGYHKNAAWIMNSSTANAVRKFKNGEGNYLWTDSLAAGQPPSLLGYPVWLDEHLPAIGADATPILFGDFHAGYTIVDHAAGLRIIRDQVTSKGMTKFYAARRVAGAAVDFHAIKALKIAAS